MECRKYKHGQYYMETNHETRLPGSCNAQALEIRVRLNDNAPSSRLYEVLVPSSNCLLSLLSIILIQDIRA